MEIWVRQNINSSSKSPSPVTCPRCGASITRHVLNLGKGRRASALACPEEEAVDAV